MSWDEMSLGENDASPNVQFVEIGFNITIKLYYEFPGTMSTS